MSAHVRNFDSINKLVDLLTDADGVVKLSINLTDKEGQGFAIPLSEVNEVYNWLAAVEAKLVITPIEFYRQVSKAFIGVLPFIESKAVLSSLLVTVKETEVSVEAVIGGITRQFVHLGPRRGELIFIAHLLGRLHDSLKLLVWSWDNDYVVSFANDEYTVTDLTALATNAAAEEQAKESTDATS